MHVGLIIDDERLQQEQAMLNRLCIGLMAEGVQVTRIVPDGALPDNIGKGEKRIALAPRLEVPMKVLPWLRQTRANRLAAQLERAMPTVLYATGNKGWKVGMDLARCIRRPLVLDVCSEEQVRNAPRRVEDSMIAAYITCTQGLSRVLAERVDSALISLVPMGVSLPQAAEARDAETVSIAIVGCCRNVNAYGTALSALDRVLPDKSNVQAFLELRGPMEHEVWREAQRLDVLRWVSIVADASVYRHLLASCDLLILPEPHRAMRSVVLEAMSHELPIVAATDSVLDMLIDGETALIAPMGDEQAWERQLGRVMADRAFARSLGQNARRLVSDQYRSSQHVAKLIEALERAENGGNYQFKPPDGKKPHL